VDITPATTGTSVPDFGYVPSGRAKGTIADVSEQVAGGLDEITALVKDVRAGKGTVGKLMTDEQLYVELRQFTASASGVTEAIQKGRGTIGRLVTDRKAADALEASLKNLQTMTDRLNAGEGSLGKLLKDEAFAQSLQGTSTNLRTLTERL